MLGARITNPPLRTVDAAVQLSRMAADTGAHPKLPVAILRASGRRLSSDLDSKKL